MQAVLAALAVVIVVAVIAPLVLALCGVLVVAVALPVLLFRAWVVRDLWRWFAVPLGFPALSLWHICGLLGLWTVLSYRYKDTPEGQWKKELTQAVVFHLVAWGFGWFYHVMGAM